MEIAFPILFLTVACALLGVLAYPRVSEGGGTGDGDICKLPPTNNSGGIECLASSSGFTFNFTQGKCVSYDSGGCGETGNFFVTEQECNGNCSGNGTSAKGKGREETRKM
uniref:Kunitz salivary protein n=1 Tax=Ornithodoros parkeri TaxID=140564 RepID=A6N9R0_ORNPR|nr:kunitz salivary protein [Ornithodoros parkeri]